MFFIDDFNEELFSIATSNRNLLYKIRDYFNIEFYESNGKLMDFASITISKAQLVAEILNMIETTNNWIPCSIINRHIIINKIYFINNKARFAFYKNEDTFSNNCCEIGIDFKFAHDEDEFFAIIHGLRIEENENYSLLIDSNYIDEEITERYLKRQFCYFKIK